MNGNGKARFVFKLGNVCLNFTKRCRYCASLERKVISSSNVTVVILYFDFAYLPAPHLLQVPSRWLLYIACRQGILPYIACSLSLYHSNSTPLNTCVTIQPPSLLYCVWLAFTVLANTVFAVKNTLWNRSGFSDRTLFQKISLEYDIQNVSGHFPQ